MTALARPQTGWILDERYALEEVIGEGGMAIVWRAMHQRLQHPVAVKFLRRSGDDDLRRRFLREAQVAAAIRHRHVVDVLDVGVEQGWVYMVMELLEGKTLHQLLDEGPMSLPQTIRITAQVLGGLAAVHDAGMIHRDVKPDNIVLVEDADGVYPKLLDFGVSKSMLSGESGERRLNSVIPTEENMIVGTPEYMSPEQIRSDHELTPAADVYSVGVVMYEMLSGERPFVADGLSTAALMIRAATQDPRPLSDYRPDLPEPMLEFIAKAMDRKSINRFPNARAMRRGLIMAAGKSAQGLEGAAPDLAQEMRQGMSAAYEPGDSAVIYIGTSKSRGNSGPSSIATLDDLPALPAHAPRNWWAVGLGALVFAGFGVGVGIGFMGDEPEVSPEAVPAPAAQVVFTLRGLVADAVVILDGESVVGPRITIDRDEEMHQLEVTAPGFEPWTAERLADRDSIIDVSLVRELPPEVAQPVAQVAEVVPRMRSTMRVDTRPTMTELVSEMSEAMVETNMRFRDPGF